MITRINKRDDAAMRIVLTKRTYLGDILDYCAKDEIRIPCLYVEGNTKYLDTEIFQDGLLAGIHSCNPSKITFAQDLNLSLDAVLRLYMIARSKPNTEIEVKLNPVQNMLFDQVERAIAKIKSEDIKVFRKMMYQGLLSNVLEKIIEKTSQDLKQVYKGQKLIIIDTHNLYHRYYHATANEPVLNSKEENIALVHKMKEFIPKIFEMNPDFILFTDEGENLIRKEIFPEYKKNSDPDEDLVKSVDYCNQMIREMGFNVLGSKDFEADDIIASYTKEFIKYGGEVVVFSTDKDLLQLLSWEGVSIYDHFKKSFIPRKVAEAKFEGIDISKICDALALQGDPSDNVPGVRGVGKKSAAKMLKEHDGIEDILQSAPEWKKSKMKENLLSEEGRKALFMSRDLVTLYDCLAQDQNFEELRVPRNLDFNAENVLSHLNKVTS